MSRRDRGEPCLPPAHAYLVMVGVLGEDHFLAKPGPKGTVLTVRSVTDKIDCSYWLREDTALWAEAEIKRQPHLRGLHVRSMRPYDDARPEPLPPR